MNKSLTIPPDVERIVSTIGKIDYIDVQIAPIDEGYTVPEIYAAVTSNPTDGMKRFIRIRDGVTKLFGLRQLGGFREDPNKIRGLVSGDELDFFVVDAVSENELRLRFTDRHLEYHLMMIRSNVGAMSRVYVVTALRAFNRFGEWTVRRNAKYYARMAELLTRIA